MLMVCFAQIKGIFNRIDYDIPSWCFTCQFYYGGDYMKTAIIGSGAIRCLYGAYLSRDNEVIMLC